MSIPSRGVPTRDWGEFSRCRMWPIRAITHYRSQCGTPADRSRSGFRTLTAIRSTILRIEAIPSWSILTICVRTGRVRISTSVIWPLSVTCIRCHSRDFPRNFIDLVEEREPQDEDRAPGKLLFRAGESASRRVGAFRSNALAVGHAIHRDQQRRQHRHFPDRQRRGFQRARHRGLLPRRYEGAALARQQFSKLWTAHRQSFAVCGSAGAHLRGCGPELPDQSSGA